jgi:hypothetical protein
MTDCTPLDLTRFEQLLDVHGAELARWPEELRAQASALLASSAEAQLVWSRAAQVEALLDGVPDLLPSAELSARIAALPVRRPQGWAAWWPFGNPVAPLLAWGAAAAFGLFIGSGIVPGLDSVVDFAGAVSSAPDVAGNELAGSDSAGSDSAGSDSAASAAAASAAPGSDSASGASPGSAAASSDEATLDDWSDLELALGLAPEWEDEQ